MELESAMYTNCLLLGLDPNVIGAGPNSGNPRVGLFRHSNPKLGEQLLYFILSSLRGPVQSAKANSYSDTVFVNSNLDFDKVWPIFDSAQSRDFRKVVQGIISELESQGALPRSNSRVSSLATCCGPRFVELLWQLSLHALREVHRRTFPADVASNPLPTPLTDVAFSHAATLLPVTKARIALERRKFLKNAETAVQRQALWSNLAHEMTAEFRGLCAEEAYLHQELEKLHDLRNKVKLEGELWDELVSSSSQNAHMVQRATRLWDSLLSRKSQHEVLASGPIEDLIAHREHRYRISGSSLLAAMDQSSLVPSTNLAPQHLDNEETESSRADVNKESKSMSECSITCGNEEKFSRVDERSSRGQPTVDIAEVLRRWTHALQRIHKQSLQLAKANDGDGPDLLRSVHDGGTSSHAESLTETLAEHRQHLDSIQVLINQLKDVAPTIQNSISELTDEVNSLSPDLPLVMKLRANSSIEAQSSGRTLESGNDEVVEMTSRLSSIQLEKVSASPPTLKLPPLFSSTPNSSGKGGNMQKRQRSIRAAALSSQSCNLESSQDGRSDDNFEHFFAPLSRTGFSGLGQDNKHDDMKSRQLFVPQAEPPLLQIHAKDTHHANKYSGVADMLNDLDSLGEYDGVDGFLSAVGSNSPVSGAYGLFVDMDESQEQVFSPPLLMDAAILADSYEDLLAPLSDTETALMEH
ncbi:UNVERIFIED_CONTAM: AUGMIN subunit [Sesamum radiatum]|uniref:AUGMIN subunit n=1 Tax=Sesamum radiatum TaxID=300843 RepID=A0AAW2VQN1_SESRA